VVKPSPPLSFEQFQTLLADILHVEAVQVQPEAYFVTDLGVDSVRLVEMMLRLESLGVEISPDLVWRIQTVGEAYRYYQEQAGR
jgi:acyl carrier protein